ncbi:MAG: hypothetical protein COV75_09080 [Candidatus Omnitrophica bacterium CG11_big_fil_rev_8_21_14_0_20_63_9]|nr:MAG: hypothetical protein COV75_09080 [Candidatus Omnitrophica bacterium CG11_big_fil_rev_8_21_14_0_20_63_9]
MAEPSLRDVQRWMKTQIQPPAGGAVRAAQQWLNPQRDTPGFERLHVYAHGYLARMQESLAEVYEAVHHVVGEQAFAGLAGAYAARHPSHDYNLSFAGRSLPEFLAAWPRTAQWPFLPDLARLEWGVCQAFHAQLQPPVDAGQLASVAPSDWERMRFAFQPSVSCVASAWPILDIWEARQRPRQAIDIDVVGRPQQVLVFREGLTVRCELLDPAEQRVLRALLDGAMLGEACAEGSAEALSAWFNQWTRRGLITALHL